MNPQHRKNTPHPPPPPTRSPDEAPALGDPGLQALLRHSPDGLLISDECGQVVFASQVAAEALGYESPGALMAATLTQLGERFVIEEPSGPAAPDAPLPGHEEFGGLPEPDRLLRFRDPEQGWDRWVQLRTARSAKHIGRKRAVLTMVRDISTERRREVTAHFLAEAGVRLGRSLSSDRVLEHGAVMAVPFLGDECVLVQVRSGEAPTPLTWHIPTAGEDRARALVRTFGLQLGEVAATGRAVHLAPLFDGLAGPDSGSVVLAPIGDDLDRTDVAAVMLLAMAPDTGRRHHPSDLALAEQLARRVGLALANAQVLEAEQRRRNLVEESEAWSRRQVESLEARFTTLARDLELRLDPLLRAVELLQRPTGSSGTQRQLMDLVRRQSKLLRDLAEAARDVSSGLETGEVTLVDIPRTGS